MELFFSFILASVISAFLMPILIRSAKFLHMVDEPGERKVHVKAIPRCGGLGLSIATLATVFILAPSEGAFISLLVGGSIIVLFGVLDDILTLAYKWKFLGQFIAVFVVIYQGIYLKYLPFIGLDAAPLWVAYPLTFLFVVGVTNAVNLSDGLDGLAAGIMLMTLAAVAFFAVIVEGNHLAMIALALVGGVLGFLRFNSHPAIVFMGDTGSQFIGFMAAFLSIFLVNNVHVTLNPALPLLLLGLPVLDTLMVMTQRIANGKSPFSPDKRHIHHKLLSYGLTHAEAVACIYVMQSVFLLAAFLLRYQSDVAVLGVYCVICGAILLFFYRAEKTGWRLRVEEGQSDRRRNVLRRYDWLYWASRIYIEYGLTFYLWVVIVAMLKSFDLLREWNQLLLLVPVALLSLAKEPLLSMLVKLCVYITGTFSGFVLTAKYFDNVQIDWVVNGFLLLLLVVIFAGIRVTRKNVFSFSTQDILISLFVLSVVLLSDSDAPVNILFKLLCSAYAIEYLFNFQIRPYRFLKFSALISGVMVVAVLLQR